YLELVRASDEPDATIQAVRVDGREFCGPVIYTGALDELLDWRFGLLPYRTLRFDFRQYPQKHVQPVGTVNYTVSADYTRITEFSWLTGQDLAVTTTAVEYPLAFADPQRQIPYYPIITAANQAAYQRYRDLFTGLPQFRLLGRLAEYRYYNMDQIVQEALDLADQILAE
ncbi:MAG: UDP-galactopyranose mutase, partial [Actinomycetia bacterium]|nr:UDP-galactopyranose mutase [Actinomycetes bacterium]